MKRTAIAIIGIVGLFFVSSLWGRDESPHNFKSIGCTHCHLKIPGSSKVVQRIVFRKNIDNLCQECHEAALEDNLNHRVGIRPSMRVPDDLHLSSQGELSCITCHNPHSPYLDSKKKNRTYFLRRGMLKRELCLACHRSENFRAPSVEFELIAPSNNSTHANLRVPLIGKVSDPSLKELRISVNENSFVLYVKKGSFSTIVTLKEGANSIQLNAERARSMSINLFQKTSASENITYRQYKSHGISSKKDCAFCHEGDSGTYRIDGNNSVLCQKCHPPPGSGKYVHGPVAIGSCTICHDPHGSTNDALLTKTGEDLCFQCHIAKDALKHLLIQGAGDKSFLREKGCGFCHDPHFSDRRFLLRSRG